MPLDMPRRGVVGEFRDGERESRDLRDPNLRIPAQRPFIDIHH